MSTLWIIIMTIQASWKMRDFFFSNKNRNNTMGTVWIDITEQKKHLWRWMVISSSWGAIYFSVSFDFLSMLRYPCSHCCPRTSNAFIIWQYEIGEKFYKKKSWNEALWDLSLSNLILSFKRIWLWFFQNGLMLSIVYKKKKEKTTELGWKRQFKNETIAGINRRKENRGEKRLIQQE